MAEKRKFISHETPRPIADLEQQPSRVCFAGCKDVNGFCQGCGRRWAEARILAGMTERTPDVHGNVAEFVKHGTSPRPVYRARAFRKQK